MTVRLNINGVFTQLTCKTRYLNTYCFNTVYMIGNMILRLFYDKHDIRRHLLEIDRQEEEANMINEQNRSNKILLENVNKRMDNMEKTLEILTNDSRLKDVMEREVERLNELKKASNDFKKMKNIF